LLKPRGDVDTVAISVFAVDDYLAEIDADAHLHALVFGDIGISLR
jgi:hypothetical protein